MSSMEIFSDEWAAACRDRLNDHGRLKSVARSWSSPVALVMRPDSRLGVERERVIYLELRDGVCVAARVADEDDRARAEFILAADAAQWKRMLTGGLDPIPAVMLGKLKLERGSLAALMPHAAAARELIAAARDAGGQLPGTAGRTSPA
jgi:putative sterol carrier protein